MKSVEEYAAAYRDIVQQEVPGEQVLVVGVLSRPGSIGAALAKNKSGKSASADLPLNVVAAGDGSAFQLDSNRSIGQYNKMNDGLLAELGGIVSG